MLTKNSEVARQLAVLESFFSHAPIGFVFVDCDFHVIQINDLLASLYALNTADILGKKIPDLVPQLWSILEPVYLRARAGESVLNHEISGQTSAAESPFWHWQTWHYPIYLAEELIGIAAIVIDITEQKRAELHLLDKAIQAVSQGILITDASRPDHPIIFVSPGFEQMTGYSRQEIIGQNCRFLQGKNTDPDAVAQLHEAIGKGQGCTVELLNYRKDGSSFWNKLAISVVLDPQGKVTHFVGVQTDVTQRRLLQAQFHQAQKMETIGQLAGGITHELNNLLTIINGYSELLLDAAALEDPRRVYMEAILKAGERSATLTHHLLVFSQKQVLDFPRLIDVNDVVNDNQKILQRIIGEDIQLTRFLQPQLHGVRVAPGQCGQLILNLAIHARESMPKGGKLTIETRNSVLEAGRYVTLVVTDTGQGMTEEIKSHLFDTTQELDAGLGLAVVADIVKQSNGFIEVHSQLGVGTSFIVYLPAAKRDPSESLLPLPALTLHGTETILLVEDEENLRELIRMILQEYGYSVLVAASGEEALRLASKHQTAIDLLLTDVVMTGMGGRMLAERLSAVRQEMKVLYISGYSGDAFVRQGILHKQVNLLVKPFLPRALLHKLREVFAS